MNIDKQTILELRTRVTAAVDDANKAAGRLEEVQRTMKSEFGVSSLKEAKAKLAKMDNELAKRYAEIERLSDEVKEGLAELMDEDEENDEN